MDHLEGYKTRYGSIFAGGTSIIGVVASTLLSCSRRRKFRGKLCICGVLLIIFITIIATLINLSPIHETHGDIVYLLAPAAIFPLCVNIILMQCIKLHA